MELSQLQLKAFSEIARLGSFTKAAVALALTQSALSHRIRQLEEELGTAVFIRAGHSVRMTETGQRLLQYCNVQKQAEEELLHDLKPDVRGRAKLAGRIRIGGVSTVMRSMVLPILAGLIRRNPDVRLDFVVRETAELKRLLASGEVDFLISTEPIEMPGVVSIALGHEDNRLVQAAKHDAVPDVYLDHDANDMTTYAFFKHQGRKDKILVRSFLDDIYGLIDAVAEGIGKAVLPSHLIESDKRLKIVSGLKPLLIPIHLYYFDQPFYTKLHQHVREELVDGFEQL